MAVLTAVYEGLSERVHGRTHAICNNPAEGPVPSVGGLALVCRLSSPPTHPPTPPYALYAVLPPPSCSLRRPGPRPSLRCAVRVAEAHCSASAPRLFATRSFSVTQDGALDRINLPRRCAHCLSLGFALAVQGPLIQAAVPSVKPSDSLRSSSQRTPPISICTVRQNQPCRDENHLTAHVRPAAFFSRYKIGSRPDARPSTMMIGLKVKASLFP